MIKRAILAIIFVLFLVSISFGWMCNCPMCQAIRAGTWGGYQNYRNYTPSYNIIPSQRNIVSSQVIKTPQINSEPKSIFVPTPMAVVKAMLKKASVGFGDLIYDLGSGDGRIVIAAAKLYGARGIGFEINQKLIQDSRKSIEIYGVESLVKIKHQDVLTADLTKADVVTMYLFPNLIRKLIPQLKTMKPGARIITYSHPIPDWKIRDKFTISVDGKRHFIYLYVMPDYMGSFL